MEDSVTATPKRAAALFGAAFALVFLMMYDPDALPPGLLGLSKWLVLLPAAFVLALGPAGRAWSRGLALTGGVFVGVCLAAILHQSNLWPIAGVYWTAVWLPPIAIGSVAGMLVAWAFRGERR
ncbi:MAG TPA: hypothetical protein VF322_11500 [Gammaproteobacteria bacterium]